MVPCIYLVGFFPRMPVQYRKLTDEGVSVVKGPEGREFLKVSRPSMFPFRTKLRDEQCVFNKNCGIAWSLTKRPWQVKIWRQ